MEGSMLNLKEPLKEDGSKQYVTLTKDRKLICRTQCVNPPIQVPSDWDICSMVSKTRIDFLAGVSCFSLSPACVSLRDRKEWDLFLGFLQKNKKVAVVRFEFYEFFIFPPDECSFSYVKVAYRMQNAYNACDGPRHEISVSNESKVDATTCLSPKALLQIADTHASKPQPFVRPDAPLEKNCVRADPSYLKTLGQAHSGWIFGAIAELVDNSRDAKATKLDIFIESVYSERAVKEIPMLSVIDDGHGMTHQEIVRMISFGHKQPNGDDPDRIGRFGIGFKAGAMRLGRDALVLTQTANSRSVAFLSQSLNEEKDNLEIPIVSYRRRGQFMEVDTSVQSEALAKHNLKAIKEFSPFNKYLIGEKAGLFQEKGTGTQIYIWNLDEWGSDYCLEWQTGMCGGSSFHKGDILIRSKRIRSRPGQTSRQVPLDYSLRAYLEVIFLDPRMKIFVQGSLVKSRPLAKSLSKTAVENGHVMGKEVELTIGRCQLELEQANCGIFLYWHGRLIEAYKRVGGMIHNADMGRGVIGVIDVTDLMNDGNGRVWVHSNKQGFQDCEQYALLEEWLGNKADEYWDRNFDTLQLKKGNTLYKPDHEWVQCDKCRKWRKLSSGFDIRSLPQEWFCYMKPFNGLCQMAEQKSETGVITVSAKRSGYHLSTMGQSDDSGQTEEEDSKQPPVLKRLRRKSAK